MADTYEMVERAARRTEEIVARVAPGSYGGSTPCEGWTVERLMRHLIAATAVWGSLARTGRWDAEIFPGLGTDARLTFRSVSVELIRALQDAETAGRELEAPLWHGPARRLVWVPLNEIVVHGWDLAVATGQRADFEDDIATYLLEKVQDNVGDAARTPPHEVYGPPTEMDESAPAIDRLVAYLGRRVP